MRRRPELAVALLAAVGCRAHAPEPVAEDLPGAPRFSATLRAELAGLGDRGEAPARLRGPDGRPRWTNRLARETSPYLLLHAHEPVDWYAWGDEAFAAARRLDRPILLSIGYSTCHWCHVMAAESFDDETIARYLNQHFVAIKVDREERPDIDASFLAAAAALGVEGGWPLTVLLTAAGEPFFAGTYFPPRDRDGQVGLVTVLEKAADAFASHRGDLEATGAEVTRALAADRHGAGAGQPTWDLIARALTSYRAEFDGEDGGLARPGQRTKFPADLPIRLLLRAARRTHDHGLTDMALVTLDRMASGGLFDQIGGGFHRYATDLRWQVPHFEKMLYDNALLAAAYTEAYQAAGRADDAEVAERTLGFMSRDLALPGGGLAAALDADSPRGGDEREGAFYLWTPAEVRDVLGADAALVAAYLGISQAGNFDGESVAHRARPLAEVAASVGLDEATARARIAAALPRLLAARDARPHPRRDDKMIAAWNGFALSAYARAALVLPHGDAHRREALALGDAIVRQLMPDGALLHSCAGGRPGPPGQLDDHAAVLAGFLDLFELTGDAIWLRRALALAAELERRFADPAGGYDRTASEPPTAAASGPALRRDQPVRDDAVPSGNSLAVMDLVRLGALTGQAGYLERADRALRRFAGDLEAEPTGSAELLLALDRRLDRVDEVVLVAPHALAELAPLEAALAGVYDPSKVVVRLVDAPGDPLATLLPPVAGKRALAGKPTAYVCDGAGCRLPTSDPARLAAALAEVRAPALAPAP